MCQIPTRTIWTTSMACDNEPSGRISTCLTFQTQICWMTSLRSKLSQKSPQSQLLGQVGLPQQQLQLQRTNPQPPRTTPFRMTTLQSNFRLEWPS